MQILFLHTVKQSYWRYRSPGNEAILTQYIKINVRVSVCVCVCVTEVECSWGGTRLVTCDLRASIIRTEPRTP